MVKEYMTAIPDKLIENSTCGIPRPNSWVMLHSVSLAESHMPWLGFILGQTPASIWYLCADQVRMSSRFTQENHLILQSLTFLDCGMVRIKKKNSEEGKGHFFKEKVRENQTLSSNGSSWTPSLMKNPSERVRFQEEKSEQKSDEYTTSYSGWLSFFLITY